MTYELAKQLKDAEFAQDGYGVYIEPGERQGVEIAFKNTEAACYIPTLSELIEACGNGLGSLERRDNQWFAFGNVHIPEFEGTGSTPEEAVAHLWLVLISIK